VCVNSQRGTCSVALSTSQAEQCYCEDPKSSHPIPHTTSLYLDLYLSSRVHVRLEAMRFSSLGHRAVFDPHLTTSLPLFHPYLYFTCTFISPVPLFYLHLCFTSIFALPPPWLCLHLVSPPPFLQRRFSSNSVFPLQTGFN
jgi:hypothetical protein